MPSEFWIQRDNIRDTKFIEVETAALSEKHILLKIEHFAFTANNISYAHSGESLGYWQFFPTDADGWGKLPVWGYAEVIESKHPEIKAAERYFGFFPFASHVIMQADRVSAAGFVDATPHRQALPAVYNRYIRSAKSANDDYLNSLLRPMFITSFLLDDFLADNDFFGADMIMASSASSKTAYAMAYLLHKHRAERRPYEIIGLTSPKNVDFVQSLGIYDRVLIYDDLNQLDNQQAAVYVDFASNAALRKTIHEHFGTNLAHNAIVGGTHWDKLGSTKGLDATKPEFFFAPTHIQKRLVDWGREAYGQKSESAFVSFLDAARDWIDVTVGQGQAAIHKKYQSMLDGQSDPRAGIILSF
jgi:hypothetical protein